ncbi:hypothetical protein CPB83DRAFT_746262, partial [Crepidotus variabilis]
IKIAALNIRGHGNLDPLHSDNKWNHLNQLIREQKIGILVVGEAHLDVERRDRIETLFNKRMRVIFTKKPDTPNAAGVAIIFNKELTNVKNLTTHEVIPDHAMLVETTWHDQSKLSMLAVYAPNTTMTANGEFWQKIDAFFERNRRIRKPDIMLGDCNVTEDKMDRVPMRDDHTGAVEALDNLKISLQLIDGWRMTYPDHAKFTHVQKLSGHQTRLDQIYIKAQVFENTYEWEIKQTGIRTDHSMVSVKLTDKSAPKIGHGRWTWPINLLKDKILMEYIHSKGVEVGEKMDKMLEDKSRSVHHNPQSLWAKMKNEIRDKAQERAKVVISKLTKEI